MYFLLSLPHLFALKAKAARMEEVPEPSFRNLTSMFWTIENDGWGTLNGTQQIRVHLDILLKGGLNSIIIGNYFDMQFFCFVYCFIL